MQRKFKCELRIATDDKIAGIKAIRDTFGLGLKEARDFVEESKYIQTVLMTEEQTKNLVFHNWMRRHAGLSDDNVSILSIERHDTEIRDLSNLGVGSSACYMS